MEIFFVPVALLFLAAPILAVVALVWVSRLDRRLRAIEREILDLGRPARPASTGPPPRPSPPPERRNEPAPPTAPEAPVRPPPKPPQEPPAPDGRPALEVRIGVRWFNVAGIISLLFGLAFMLKYAYENAWIGPRGRVAIGVACGVAAILLGEAGRRRGHRIFSQGLTGGGIAALYLSFFFSFRLYQLIEVAPAFVLMAAVTVCGLALALLSDSMAVAILAFLGGYLTPVLLSTGLDAAEFLFAYLTVLALGALVVDYFKRWRPLDILSFAGTALLYTGWQVSYYRRERLGVAVAGLAVFFAIFLLVPYAHNLVRKVGAGARDHVLALANAAFTFGFLYRMIHPISDMAVGFIALALSACYVGLGSYARRRLPEDRGLTISILGISIAFLTLAIPLQLGLHGITIAWAAQGLLILYLGFRYGAALTRLAGLAILGLSAARLLIKHTPLHTQPFTIFWNPTFGTWTFVVAALLGAAWLYRRNAGRVLHDESALAPGAMIAAAVALIAALNLEIESWCTLWSLGADFEAGAIMLLWAIFPLALMVVGRRLQQRAVEMTGLAFTLAALVPFARLAARVAEAPGLMFFNFVFWMSMLGVASFFATAYWMRRPGGAEAHAAYATHAAPISKLLFALGVFLLLVLLTAEVHGHYRLQPGTADQTARNHLRALLSVSVVWTLFASSMMAIGFIRSSRPFRYGASGLFGLTLLKVFLVDVWELREIYRIVSFVVLGLLLVAASFLYSRFRARVAMVALCAALGALGGSSAYATHAAPADFTPTRWERMREIQTAGLDGPFAWAVLDQDVLDRSRRDLADLRVIGRDGLEVPYVARAREGGIEEHDETPEILNRAAVEGLGVRVELEFRAKVLKNVLEVETLGADFRRRVKVEGSDGGSWATLVERAWIYRVPPSGSLAGVRFEEVALPDNDYSRLRLTVFPMPEEKDPVVLRAVRSRKRTVVEPETEPLRPAGFSVDRDPNARATIIEVDFGYRNARVQWVEFDFEDEAFRRAWRAYGRNEKVAIVSPGRTEGGDLVKKEIEAPWDPLESGVFLRLPPGSAGEAAIDQTRVVLRGASLRYLRVVIQDQDDRPLHPRGVTALGLVQRVVFPHKPGGAYTLYYGNSEASHPAYDLPALLPDLSTHPPAVARLGPATTNPRFDPVGRVPFSERFPWMLWLVLLTAVAILASIVIRNLRAVSPNR